MNQPPLTAGTAFSSGNAGDLKSDTDARRRFAMRVGAPQDWATVHQVHGDVVVRAESPGVLGDADAVWTSNNRIAVAVFTADCLGVVVHAADAVGVAHAGWRGAVAAVVDNLVETMSGAGHTPVRAAIGPGIGPCCFEVGEEVASKFPDNLSTTSWGTTSVDLGSVILAQLSGIPTQSDARCTMHDAGLFSHRKDATSARMAAVGWL